MFKTNELRRFIYGAFNASELEELCYTHFPTVQNGFTVGQTLDDRVKMLIKHVVGHHNEEKTLLIELINARPAHIKNIIATLDECKEPKTRFIWIISISLLATMLLVATNLPSVRRSIPWLSCPEGILCQVFPQAVDGQIFTWISSPGSFNAQLTKECAQTGDFGVQLTYNFTDAGHGGWGVFWDNPYTPDLNLSGYKTLSFGTRGRIGGEKFIIGIQDIKGAEAKHQVTAVSAGWFIQEIPLDVFQGVDRMHVRNVNIGFNREHGQGTICIDDIKFR